VPVPAVEDAFGEKGLLFVIQRRRISIRSGPLLL
jgi:hypothetical protein